MKIFSFFKPLNYFRKNKLKMEYFKNKKENNLFNNYVAYFSQIYFAYIFNFSIFLLDKRFFNKFNQKVFYDSF